MGLDPYPLLNTFYEILNHSACDNKNSNHACTCVHDAKAMEPTPADMKEYPNSYVFVDMPGLKSGDIKVQVDEDNVLMVCGERQRGVEKVGVKFVRMERNGKFMRKFVLRDNANLETIKAACQDGVLTVTVEKNPKIIQVKFARLNML